MHTPEGKRRVHSPTYPSTTMRGIMAQANILLIVGLCAIFSKSSGLF